MPFVNRSIQQTVPVSDPPTYHPMVDGSGRITPPWQAWFNAFYTRVGRGANDNIENARNAGEIAGIGADQSGDIAATADELRDEIASIVDTSEGRLAAAKDELRGEAAAVVEGVSNQAFRDFVNSQFVYETDWSQQINDAADGVLPDQAGNAGKYLSTDGTTAFWDGDYLQAVGRSSSYGSTSGTSTGAFNAVMGAAASATWLLSGTSGGTFRAGIQALDAGGVVRLYEGSNHYDFSAGDLAVPGKTTTSTLAVTAPSTVNAATYTVTSTDSSLIFTTTACTVTLPFAASHPGRIIYVKNVTAHAVTSVSSNVCPLGSAAAGTAVLAATAGKFAMLQSDGTNWVVMMAN